MELRRLIIFLAEKRENQLEDEYQPLIRAMNEFPYYPDPYGKPHEFVYVFLHVFRLSPSNREDRIERVIGTLAMIQRYVHLENMRNDAKQRAIFETIVFVFRERLELWNLTLDELVGGDKVVKRRNLLVPLAIVLKFVAVSYAVYSML